VEGGRWCVEIRLAGTIMDMSRAREGIRRVPGRVRGRWGREKGNLSVQRGE